MSRQTDTWGYSAAQGNNEQSQGPGFNPYDTDRNKVSDLEQASQRQKEEMQRQEQAKQNELAAKQQPQQHKKRGLGPFVKNFIWAGAYCLAVGFVIGAIGCIFSLGMPACVALGGMGMVAATIPASIKLYFSMSSEYQRKVESFFGDIWRKFTGKPKKDDSKGKGRIHVPHKGISRTVDMVKPGQGFQPGTIMCAQQPADKEKPTTRCPKYQAGVGRSNPDRLPVREWRRERTRGEMDMGMR